MSPNLKTCILLSALMLPLSLASSPPVTTKASPISEVHESMSVPVIISPSEKAKLASPLTGFIEKINFKVGQIFNKNDVLVDFDCTVLRSEKEKVEAIVNGLSTKAEGLERLFKLDGASKLEVTETRSKLREAQEELEIKTYLVNQCQLKAPFKGQVTELYASGHEYIEQGKPLMDIVNLGDLELKLILPSEWLSWIKEGTEFSVSINETQKIYKARISRLTYAIDPVSNTFTAYGAFNEAILEITPGMSGNAEFKR